MRLLPLILLLTSCASLHTELGISDPALGMRDSIRRTNSLEPLQAIHVASRAEQCVIQTDYASVDLGLGPSYVQNHDSWALGAEASLRIRWSQHPTFQPYVLATQGFMYAEGWEGSDVNYTFNTSFGVGAQFNLSERWAVTADYRWLHLSNGKSFHSDQTRDIFGLKNPDQNSGQQNGALLVGLLYHF